MTLAVVIGFALLGTVLMHRKYQSNAKLVVQNVRTPAQLSTSSVDHLVSQGDISQAEINTEVDLLQSDDVARRAPRLDGSGRTRHNRRESRGPQPRTPVKCGGGPPKQRYRPEG